MLGDVLRREREKKQLTLKDVENGISIRTLYIEAIENEDFEKLPGDAYAKGFIRSYSNFLGVDPIPLLEDYRQQTKPQEPKIQPDSGIDSKKQEEPAPSVSSYSYSKNNSSSSFSSGSDFKARVETSRTHQKYIALLVVLVVFLGGVWIAFSDDGTNTDNAKPTVKNEQQKKSDKKAQPKDEVQQDGVNVTAKFENKCWTQVAVDGKVVFEGTVEGGKTMDWKGQKNVAITAGNAGAVEITYNGESQGKMGAEGEVIEKNYGEKAASDDKS